MKGVFRMSKDLITNLIMTLVIFIFGMFLVFNERYFIKNDNIITYFSLLGIFFIIAFCSLSFVFIKVIKKYERRKF